MYYVAVSQGLGTTVFTNLIGLNWYYSGLDFLDRHQARTVIFCGEKLKTKIQIQKILNFLLEVPKSLTRSKADEKTLADLSSAHRLSQDKRQLVISNKLFFFLVCHIIKIFVTEFSRSVLENTSLSRVYRPPSSFSQTYLPLG